MGGAKNEEEEEEEPKEKKMSRKELKKMKKQVCNDRWWRPCVVPYKTRLTCLTCCCTGGISEAYGT